MHVLYDYQIFLNQKIGGISRYHYKLFNSLLKLSGQINPEIIHYFTENEYLNKGRRIINFPQKINTIRKLNQFIVSQKIQKTDVFHPTYYDPYFLKINNLPPFILTIHDMIQELLLSENSNYAEIVQQKALLMERAAAIISISEATKKDIIKLYKIDESKIHVIHHGDPDYFFSFGQSKPTNEVKKDYVLFVGHRRGYKNFDFFIDSVSRLQKQNNIKLKVIGHPPSTEDVALVKKNKLEHLVEFHQNVTEQELFNFYRSAICFVFPSLYEGFGIPLLEAFYANCPVLCSDIPCFREVAGDAASYFNPKSRDSLVLSLLKIIESSEFQQQQIEKGKVKLSNYSWRKTALETLDVYNKLH